MKSKDEELKTRYRLVNLWLAGAVVLIALVLYVPRITEPFWGHHDWNGVFYGAIARNYLAYGLIKTKGAQVLDSYPLPKAEWSIHTHHPATFPLLLAGWKMMFGDSEAAARSMGIVATIVGMLGLARLNQKAFSSWQAGLAPLVLMASPLLVYYGSMPVFEIVLQAFFVWGVYFYWTGRKKSVDRVTLIICSLAFLVDWAGFWLGFGIGIVELISGRRKRFLRELVAAMVVTSGVILGHQWIVTGNAFGDFLKVGLFRLGANKDPFTIPIWVYTVALRTKAFWGYPILLASLAGHGVILWKRRELWWLSLLTGMVAVSHSVVFRNIAWYHDYMLLHSIPFVGLGLGGLLWLAAEKIKREWVIGLLAGLTLATILSTWQFSIDLINLRPHKKCVELGKRAAESEEKLSFGVTKEEVTTCWYVTSYYARKPVELKPID